MEESKTFFSDKIVSTKRITSIDNVDGVLTEQDTAHVLNAFFSNIVANFKIPEYTDCDPIASNICDPVLKSLQDIGITLA